MIRMTLEKFKEKYYPNLSQGQLCQAMGISDSEFSKIKKQELPTSYDAFKKANTWMINMHQIILTYDSPAYVVEQKYEKKVKALERELREANDRIQELEQQIVFYEDLKKLIKHIKTHY